MEEKKESKLKKILLILSELLFFGSLLLLVVFGVVSVLSKDVSALEPEQEYTLEINKDNFTDYSDNIYSDVYLIYFNPFDKSLPVGYNSTFLEVRYQNNTWLAGANVNRWADNNYTVYFKDNQTALTSNGINSAFCFYIYFDYGQNCFVYGLRYLKYDETTTTFSFISIGSQDYYIDNVNEIKLVIRTRFWLKTGFGVSYDTTNLSEAIKDYYRTNINFVDDLYKEDHLFGNLVSSFMNIQFGRVAVGNTTYDLTLGLLFLFILGLGALFVIIKVFLGG